MQGSTAVAGLVESPSRLSHRFSGLSPVHRRPFCRLRAPCVYGRRAAVLCVHGEPTRENNVDALLSVFGVKRRVVLPSTLVAEFERIAKPNTDEGPYGIETCGILAGRLVREGFCQAKRVYTARICSVPK